MRRKRRALNLRQAREVGAQDIAVERHAHALADARHIDEAGAFQLLEMVRERCGADFVRMVQGAAGQRRVGAADLLEDLVAACQHDDARVTEFDTSCFSGEYVTGDVTREYLERLQVERSDAAKSLRREPRGKLKVIRGT